MKHVVAVLSALVMFVLSFVLFGLIARVLPYSSVSIYLGSLETDVGSLITVVPSFAAAIHSFQFTLRRKKAKTPPENTADEPGMEAVE